MLRVLFILLFALTACTPAVQGSTATRPFNLNEGPVALSAGTYYASHQTAPKNFGFRDDDFARTAVQNPRKGKRTYTNVTKRLSIVNASMPENWSVNLRAAKLVKEVKRARRKNVSYTRRLDLTFRVDVPSGVTPGAYRGSVRIRERGGQERNVPLRFVVEQQAVR